MMTHFIGYFFINLCSLFFYFSFLRIEIKSLKRILLILIPILFVPFISYTCSSFTNNSIGILVIAITDYLLLTLLFKLNYHLSLITLLLSYGLSFVFLAFSSLLVSIICLIVFKTYDSIPFQYVYLPSGIIQLGGSILAIKSKRFRNGFFPLIHSNKSTPGLIFSLTFILFITLSSVSLESAALPRNIATISVLIIAFFLFYYWRYRITQTYREKLRIANEKSLEDELHNQRERIADLEADNARLSQIVHKDNKIILAMLTVVTEHLENTTGSTPEELAIQGKELSTQLQDMAKDRQGILSTQIRKTNILPKSGLHTVDGMLSFMETRAKEAGITYKLQIEENIKEIASNAIPEADLLHLLGDLIDNAIIATKHANDKRKLLIHLGRLQNHFLLEISDSGIPFSLDTYQSFGNEPHTTHGSDGGSGIGLMDIWKLKKKYKASLHIYEYEEGEGIYTKKLTFIFDYKNHFLLQTPRYKEAVYTLTRGDLHIFPTKTE